MVNRLVFWTCFGFANRWLQMGIEMRAPFERRVLYVYPIYMTCGFGFGYWLQTVDDKQTRHLMERKQRLLDKRARKAKRDANEAILGTQS